MPRLPFAIALGCVLFAGSSTRAVVEAEMPLVQLVKDSQLIAVVTLEKVDPEVGKGVLKLERILQGDNLPESIPIKLVAAAGGEGNPHAMLDWVRDGTPLVLFFSSLSPQEHQALAYGNGSWFKLRGVDTLDKLKFVFLQGEPYLCRTFHGDNAELVTLLDDFAAGKGTLPGLDKSVKPGLGPTLKEASPAPEVAASVTNPIEIGPAWRIDDGVERSERPSAAGNYVVITILFAAAFGLVFMLTRSAPGAAA